MTPAPSSKPKTVWAEIFRWVLPIVFSAGAFYATVHAQTGALTARVEAHEARLKDVEKDMTKLDVLIERVENLRASNDKSHQTIERKLDEKGR